MPYFFSFRLIITMKCMWQRSRYRTVIELPAAGSVAAVSESQSQPRKGEDKWNARTGGHQWVADDTLAILKHREKLVCRKEAGPTLLHNLSRHPGNKGMSEPRATGDAVPLEPKEGPRIRPGLAEGVSRARGGLKLVFNLPRQDHPASRHPIVHSFIAGRPIDHTKSARTASGSSQHRHPRRSAFFETS